MRRIVIGLFVLLFPVTGFAAQQCYNMQQLEAEQGIRIHSELMTIALNCQHLAGTTSLYNQYEHFTKNNLTVIKEYEDAMRRFFASEGQNGETALNTFRTVQANRIAQEAVRLQPNVFCRAYKGMIAQANAMSSAQYRLWAQTVFPGYVITRPLCQGVTPRTQAAPKH